MNCIGNLQICLPVAWLLEKIVQGGTGLIRWLSSLCGRTQEVQDLSRRIIEDFSFVPLSSLDITQRRFQHLEAIKKKPNVLDEHVECAYRRLFQAATRGLYQQFTMLSGEVQILVRNASDGFGDHACGVQAADFLLEDFPNIKLELNTFFEQKLETLPELKKPASTHCETRLYREFPAINDEPLTELKEKIQRASCVLEMAYRTSRGDLGLEALREGPSTTYLREYGSGEYICHDALHELYLGLADIEEGLFIKELPKRSLVEMSDYRMKELLFQKQNPTSEEVERYLGQRHLHLFYHKMSSFYQASDLYISAHLHKDDNKPIDIVMSLDFSLKWLVHWKILDVERLKALGIGSICVLKRDSEETLQIQERGKEMRIIYPAFLPQSDFYALASNAEEPIGCTGDHSLTDILALQRSAHYEIRSHKCRLFKSFKELAASLGCTKLEAFLQATGELFDGHDELYEQQFKDQQLYYDVYKTTYLTRRAALVADQAQKIVACLQEPALDQEWQRVRSFIKKERNARHTLGHIVARHLAFAHYPQLVKAEGEAYNAFRSGTKSLRTVYQELETQIKDRKTNGG